MHCVGVGGEVDGGGVGGEGRHGGGGGGMLLMHILASDCVVNCVLCGKLWITVW